MPNSKMMQSIAASRKRTLMKRERAEGRTVQNGYFTDFLNDDEGTNNGGRGRGVRPTAQELKRAALTGTTSEGTS